MISIGSLLDRCPHSLGS